MSRYKQEPRYKQERIRAGFFNTVLPRNFLERSLLLRWLIFAAFGAVTTLAFAPFGYWYAAILSHAGFLLIALMLQPSFAYSSAFFYGMGYWVASTHWIVYSLRDFGNVPLPISILVMTIPAIIYSMFLMLQLRILYATAGPSGIFGYVKTPLLLLAGCHAGLWFCFDLLRTLGMYGFPWSQIGYGFLDTPLKAFIPYIGSIGLSFIVPFTVAACLILVGQLLQIRTAKHWLAESSSLVFALAIIVALALLLPKQQTAATNTPISVSLVQGNVSIQEKWLSNQQHEHLLRYAKLSVSAPRDALIIWGESAIAGLYRRYSRYVNVFKHQLLNSSNGLIFGTLRRGSSQKTVFNSIAFEQVNTATQFYDKQRLVPLGEFVPLADTLAPYFRLFQIPMSQLHAAITPQQPFQYKSVGIAPSICYEAVFARQIADGARNSQLLLNISDDGWFGASIGPQQHFQIARARAIENNKPLLRVGNTGITGVIDHQGNIVAKLPQFKQGVLTQTVMPYTGTTVYNRFGDTPILVLSIMLLAAGALFRILNSKTIE